MQFSYILSFVELSSFILQFDTLAGSNLRCCSRQFRQLADPEENSRALEDYVDWWVNKQRESDQEQELTKLVFENFSATYPDSDDY